MLPPLAGRTSSTVGEEKRHNLRLTKPKEEFITVMANLGLPYPKKIGAPSTTDKAAIGMPIVR